MNRCLSEGRRAFLARIEQIESGAECKRMAPLLSAMADGEASAKDMAALRPHLRTCLACRASLRDAREVPARVAAVAPIALLAGASHAAPGVGLRSALEWLHERLIGLAMRGQDVIEAATAHKVAAAAASAAALGGGGIATLEVTSSHSTHHAHHAAVARHWRPAAAVATASPRAVPAATNWSPPRRRPTPRRRAHTPPQQAKPKPQPVGPARQPASPTTPASPTAAGSPRRPAPPPATGEFGP